MARGRSLELYFVDGLPDGLTTAELFGWTGHVLRIPRLRLVDGLARREAAHTGVYLLCGEGEDGPVAYMGEAENVAKRIRQHDAARDWWDEAVILTTSADHLHKAHVRWLEAALLQKAREAGNARLENGNQPGTPGLSEAAVANMEEYLDNVGVVLPALGIDLLRTGRRVHERQREMPELGAVFHLRTPAHDVEGQARMEGSDFVVLAGSKPRGAWASKAVKKHNYQALYEKLVSEGIIAQKEGAAIFVSDYAFSSPSAAAAILNGRAANGRIDWRTPDGRTFAEWEAVQLQEAP
ncbi:GIY-YIG nuclease family protein [Jannaschia sp. W003]|uniref:GIY-YIG nuclease family protein n=1 Tax=Jannaschia sp. W003 TaxID=2867012 RepID=UPI0021A38E2E|nr:GIY-YIG nuclease family protein [Jannaschia sp. W003]UWQ20371.1 GIY-YIG nuclease family protein [Jannaschia sp. W003]